MTVAVEATHPAADMFPLLEGAELDRLADDVRANGLREPVWLYDDPERGTVLLDGRNRVRACEIAGVPVQTRRYAGDDPFEFVWSQNVHRRHLNPGQTAFALLAREELEAAEAANRVGGRPPKMAQEPVATWPQVSDAPKKRAPLARDRAASGSGVSGRTVARAKRVAEQAPDLAAKVRAGTVELSRADRIVRDREAAAKRVARAKADAEATPTPLTVDIRHGDFRDVLADLRDVDAIVTDPPYPFEFLPLLDDLAAWADKVLSPDGVLAVLIGQTHLPEVYRRLGGHRPYRWTGCYVTEGPGYVSQARKVQSSWKPLLVYGGGPRFGDVVRSTGDDKSHHRWGQNYDAFHTIVERLTSPGQTVVDPFAGSGTTLLAAYALGRNAVGCDVDAEAVATARERLS